MRATRLLVTVSTVGLVLPVTAPAGAAAGRAPASDSPAPTAIELALAEHSCEHQTSIAASDRWYECIDARVDALRAEFGYDLGKLSAARRRSIDKVCGGLRAEGRDAYLDCLSRELMVARRPEAPSPSAAPPNVVLAQAPVAPPAEAPRSSSWIWLVRFLGALLVAAAAAVVALRVNMARHRRRNGEWTLPPPPRDPPGPKGNGPESATVGRARDSHATSESATS